MNALREVAILFVYSLACLNLGVICLRGLGWTQSQQSSVSSITHLSSALLLGQGILALVLTLLATAFQLKSWILWAVILALAVAGSLSLRGLLRPAAVQAGGFLQRLLEETLGWRLLALALGVLILMILASCVLPLAGWDAIAIYMANGRLMAETEGFVYVPYYARWAQSGMVGEMHYAAFISLGTGTQTPRIFGWLLTLAGTVVLSALGRRTGMGRRGQWILSLMLWTSSVLTNVIGDGKVDHYAAVLGIASFFWAAAFTESEVQRTSPIRISAVLASLSVIAKATYVVSLIFPLAIFVFWRKLAGMRRLSPGGVIAGLAPIALQILFWMTAVQLPHFIRNLVIFHEPLAPFIGQAGSAWREAAFMSPENVRRLVPVFPLALVFGDYPSPVSQYGRLSFGALAFLPFVVLLPKARAIRRSLLFQLGVCGAVGILLWTALWPSVFVPRYYMTVLLLLLLPPARAAEYASTRWRQPLRMDLLVQLTLAFVLVAHAYAYRTSYYPFAGVTNRLLLYAYDFMRRSDDMVHCADFQQSCLLDQAINRDAEVGSRMYMVGVPFALWLRPDLAQCMRTPADFYPQPDGIDANWAALLQGDFSYLLLFKSLVPMGAAGDSYFGIPGSVPANIALQTIYEDSNYVVYRVSGSSSLHTPRTACVQTSPRIWNIQSAPGQE